MTKRPCTTFVQGMADRDIPLSVFHFDCFWMKGIQLVRLHLGRGARSPIPWACSNAMHERGLQLCCWINPYIGQASSPVPGGHGEGLPAEKDPTATYGRPTSGRPGMGIRGLDQPRRAGSGTADQLRKILRHGRGLPQDRLRRAHPRAGRRLLRRLRTRCMMHNYYTYPVQQDGV